MVGGHVSTHHARKQDNAGMDTGEGAWGVHTILRPFHLPKQFVIIPLVNIEFLAS
jgi:hypothetical protein